MNAHFDPVVGQQDDYNWDFCKAYVLFVFLPFELRRGLPSLPRLDFVFSESLDASLWICAILFYRRLFLLWIFSNLSSCDFLSSFNFSISFSSSWLRFRRNRYSSCFSRTFLRCLHSICVPSWYSLTSWSS